MVGVGDIQAEGVEGHMLHRLEVIENQQREEEEEERQRGQRRQRYIQAAVKLLSRSAMGTFGKMLLIVLAHLRRDSGNIISPTRQDAAYDSICTSGCCHKCLDSLCKGCVQPQCFSAAHVAGRLQPLDAQPSGQNSLTLPGPLCIFQGGMPWR